MQLHRKCFKDDGVTISMPQYSVQYVDDVAWDKFQQSSPQRSAFSSSAFLSALPVERRFLFVNVGSEVVGGIPLLVKSESLTIPPFSVLAGIHFSDMSKSKPTKRIETQFRVGEAIAEHVFEVFPNGSFSNCPSVVDFRPFDWFNHGQVESKGGFTTTLRYTSRVRIEGKSCSSKFSQLRRRDLKLAARSGVVFDCCENVDALDSLHRLTFERQGLVRPDVETKALKSICLTATETGFGKQFSSQIDGKIVSSTLWIMDDRIAYYLFGANHPEYRNTGAATLCMWQSMLSILRERGIQIFDFVGVNSPQRGAFKLGFGGEVVPYVNVNRIQPCQ